MQANPSPSADSHVGGPLTVAQTPVVRRQKSQSHFPALDGVRGLAIALVLLDHYLITDRTTLASRLLSKIASFGWVGVDLFFVLSGFLITGILFDAKGSPHYFRNFYARRTLRIFPLYYGALLLTLVIAPALWARWAASVAPITHHESLLWLYCTNIGVTIHGKWIYDSSLITMNHFWSLAVEEQFYLTWPLMVFFFGRQVLMVSCCLAAVIALGLRFYWGHISYDPMAFYVLTPCRMDALAFGAFVALAARGPGGLAAMVRPARWIAAATAWALLAIYLQRRMWSTSVLSVRTLGISTQSVFFAAVIVLILAAPAQSLLHKSFVMPGLRALGKYSYGVYVFHAMILPMVNRYVPFAAVRSHLPMVPLAQISYLLMGCGVSIALAICSWHLYERHFLNLKRYFE